MIEKGIYKDKQLLKARIRKGIPMGIRMLAWPQIVNLRNFIDQKSKKYTYQQLVKSFSNNIYEITLDIPRTFPQEEDSKLLKKSLSNVLKALSLVYPKIGYCQGMNFSALRLLQIMDDQTAFWLLNYIYENDESISKVFFKLSEKFCRA